MFAAWPRQNFNALGRRPALACARLNADSGVDVCYRCVASVLEDGVAVPGLRVFNRYRVTSGAETVEFGKNVSRRPYGDSKRPSVAAAFSVQMIVFAVSPAQVGRRGDSRFDADAIDAFSWKSRCCRTAWW